MRGIAAKESADRSGVSHNSICANDHEVLDRIWVELSVIFPRADAAIAFRSGLACMSITEKDHDGFANSYCEKCPSRRSAADAIAERRGASTKSHGAYDQEVFARDCAPNSQSLARDEGASAFRSGTLI